MRYILLACIVLGSAACAALAQQPQAHGDNANPPAVACKSKAAMAQWMAADTDAPNRAVLDKLLSQNDCEHVPYESVKNIGFAEEGVNEPVQITVQTSKGVEHLWGYPVGE